MPTFTNIRGTSEPHFRISLSGPTIYHGTAVPSATPPTPLGGGTLNPGDIYIRTDPANTGLFVLGNAGDTDWNEFLETGGGAAIVGGDLEVQGDLDTWGDIILLNSDGGALVGGLSGLEVNRASNGGGESVQWVWDESVLAWTPSTSSLTPNSALHNVAIGNNLSVTGRLTAPDGLAATPGIRFSAAGTGIYATATTLGFSTGGSPRWLIDATGNFLPTAAQNIGATGALAGNIYGTLFAGADGASGTPTITFDSEPTTGLYKSGAGVIGFSVLGTPVASIDATEMELQGTLKLTDGTSWTVDNDGADSNKLKFAHSTTDYAILTTGGELLVGDGALANPAYSFISDDSAGMYLDTGDIKFTLDGISQNLVITPTAINAPTATVTNAQDLVTKAYVDGATGGSWREPVVVKEDINYLNLAAAEAAMNGGTVDGISVTSGDRILYTDIGGENKNVFIINGTVGAGATLVEDTNTITIGDTVYVNEGTHAGKVFSYDITLAWTEISGAGGGSTMYFDYEVQTAAGAQTVFNLASVVYAPTVDGSRLQVYVNGVKQVFGGGAAYVETNETTVTFNVAPGVGKTVEFYAVGLATVDGILSQETQTGFTGLPNPITFTSITYAVGQAGLLVYLNGQKMVGGTAYTELTGTTIQWLAPALVPGDILEFYSSVPIVAGVDLEDISNVSNVAPLNNDQLTYNTIAGEWQPVAAGSVGNGLLFDEDGNGLVGVIDGINAVFTTTDVAVQAKTGGPGKRSYQQVFVNGVLQEEGILPRDYVAGPPNTITFNVGKLPQPGDTIVVYQL